MQNPNGSVVVESPATEPGQSLTQTSSPAASIQIYTLQDVTQHANPPNDCWLVIHDKVYDVSGFGEAGHPGKTAIYQGCGKDATTLFETRPMGSGTPHSDKARGMMDRFYIGDLSQ